jgi:hypothetical protein
MTSWTVTQTHRYKAAIEGAGITDWLSFIPTSDISQVDYDMRLQEKSDEPFLQFSAVMHTDQVTTPLLILHGESALEFPVSRAANFSFSSPSAAKPCAWSPIRVRPISSGLPNSAATSSPKSKLGSKSTIHSQPAPNAPNHTLSSKQPSSRAKRASEGPLFSLLFKRPDSPLFRAVGLLQKWGLVPT